MLKLISVLSFCSMLGCASKKQFSGDTGKQGTAVPAGKEETIKQGTGKPAKDVVLDKSDTVNETNSIPNRCGTEAAKLQVFSQKIDFPENGYCDFLSPPNIAKSDLTVTASETQKVNLNLPEGVICSLKVKSSENTSMKYDDFIILTIDNHVLFSSNNKIVENFDKNKEIYDWNFSKLVGKKLTDKEWVDSHYCLGGAENCTIPKTEVAGSFDVNFPATTIAPISAMIQGKASVPVNLIVTGDNDADKDCHHTDLSLTISGQYLPN